MKIIKSSSSGSLESNDLLVFVSPNSGVKIEIDSIVKLQFEKSIYETILKVLEEFEVKDVCIKIEDKGALDFAIFARVKTALLRAGEEK
ncbi:MAG: citrate lyase acyl carrier protein [Fusobacteria bacterium]|nr:citrate lyase acyl carrier protein [Fusobacteriota bacterium]